MKKLILSSLLMLPAFSAFALEEYQYPRTKNADPQLEYNLGQEKPEVNRTTPESSMFYLKTGYSVGTIGSTANSLVPTALGNRRFADDTYYGLEISSHYKSQQRLIMANFQIGHQFVWRHRVKPYLGLMAGYARFNDKNAQALKGSGIGVGAEAGLELFKFSAFAVNAGYQFNYAFINNEQVKNIRLQTLYLMLGLKF